MNLLSVDLDFFASGQSVHTIHYIFSRLSDSKITNIILAPDHDIRLLISDYKSLKDTTIWNIDMHDDCNNISSDIDLSTLDNVDIDKLEWGIGHWGTTIMQLGAKLNWIYWINEGTVCGHGTQPDWKMRRKKTIFVSHEHEMRLPIVDKVAFYCSTHYFLDAFEARDMVWRVLDLCRSHNILINNKNANDWTVKDVYEITSQSTVFGKFTAKYGNITIT